MSQTDAVLIYNQSPEPNQLDGDGNCKRDQVGCAPLVTVIIPCRNEAEFIGKCLESVAANDYPKNRLQVLVVDGMSEDQTRAIVGGYARRWPFIQLLDNPKRVTPAALNIGIHLASGEVLMRMDAHTLYPSDYVAKSVRALAEYGADNVGGRWEIRSRSDSFVGRCIAQALSHPFGIGNAYYRFISSDLQPRWVDTVPFFCLRRKTVDRIGKFNELLARGQDMEFHLRLKREGLKTLLLPEVVSYYYARTGVGSFLKHNWMNGVWAILPFVYSDGIPVAVRHLVPLAFVSCLVTSTVLCFITPAAVWALVTIGASYSGVSLIASVHVARCERDVRYLFLMPFVFAGLHMAYGAGSLWGVAKALSHLLGLGWLRMRRFLKPC